MKKYIVLFASILAIVVFASCNREPDPVLTISGSKSFTCGPDGGSGESGVYTTYPWTASCSANWITLSQSSGDAGDSQIQYSIASSEDPEDRNALICITTQNLRDTIIIKQNQRDKIAISGEKEYSIPQKGGELDIELNTNVDYNVSSTADWINRTTTKSYSTRTESFSISPNTGYDPREAWIIFSSGELKDSIKVIQDQLDAMLVPDENTINLTRKESTFSINLSTNIDYRVSISDESWIKRIETKGLRDDKLFFSASENKSSSSRSASITITGASDIKKVFTVTQSGSNLLYVGINSSAIKAPLLKGQQLSSTVFWGDGTNEKYSADLIHYYSSKKTRTISIEMDGNTSVKFDNLVGVESINLSNF